MLPDPQNRPPRLTQRRTICCIALDVLRELCAPPVGVGGGSSGLVLRASVPKATVNENRQPQPRERDIHLASKSAYRAIVLTKTEPPAMQCGANLQFRLRIA